MHAGLSSLGFVEEGASGNLIGASEPSRLLHVSSVENENSDEPGCASNSVTCSLFDGGCFNWPMAFASG